jgi:hypothetical protein
MDEAGRPYIEVRDSGQPHIVDTSSRRVTSTDSYTLEGVDVLREASLEQALGVEQTEEVVRGGRQVLAREELLGELEGG